MWHPPWPVALATLNNTSCGIVYSTKPGAGEGVMDKFQGIAADKPLNAALHTKGEIY